MPNLVLHTIICHKPYYKTRDQALKEAYRMFPQ